MVNFIVLKFHMHDLPWTISCETFATSNCLASRFVPIFLCMRTFCFKCDATPSIRADISYTFRIFLIRCFWGEFAHVCIYARCTHAYIPSTIRLCALGLSHKFIYFRLSIFLFPPVFVFIVYCIHLLHITMPFSFGCFFFCSLHLSFFRSCCHYYGWRHHHDKIMVTIHIYGAPVNIWILIKCNKIIHGFGSTATTMRTHWDSDLHNFFFLSVCVCSCARVCARIRFWSLVCISFWLGNCLLDASDFGSHTATTIQR